jgi:hypothetical protein
MKAARPLHPRPIDPGPDEALQWIRKDTQPIDIFYVNVRISSITS